MKKTLKVTGFIVLFLLIVLALWVHLNLKDRHSGYSPEVRIISHDQAPLKVGFAAVAITPVVPDRWVDKNGDAEYHPGDGDSFTDGNGNGIFDPVWIAGFGNAKAANGIHDDLWARTMIVDDGKTRLALIVLDAIGLMNDNIIDIRQMIPAEAGVTFAIVTSTHDHEAPDLMGLWGKTPFKNGINAQYLKFVKEQAVKSVITAVKSLRPASLIVAQDLEGAKSLVKDTRDPQVLDAGLRLIKAVDKENGTTLGTLIAWADHAETLWSHNLLITSDFCHYVREGVEKGVFKGDSLVKAGVGGVAIYINGAVGGLMTTHPSISVTDPVTGIQYKDPGFEKAEAQGKALSLLSLNALEKSTERIDSGSISLLVKSISLPIDNFTFKLATALGILDRGTVGWMKMKTELAVITLGPLTFTTIPGEPYPELINGGIEAPQGRDYDIVPLELPAIRDMMPGRYKFVFGLANDEIGYIIPKSQWDEKAPFAYGRNDAPYGEENSLGPETAHLLHQKLQEMFQDLPHSN